MRIAVTGATGTLGGQVVRLLTAHDGHEVVAVSRRSPSDLPPRARLAQADYADIAALRRAFTAVDTLVFVSSDGEAVNVLHHHQNVIRAAADSGVGRIVALSGLDADITSPFCYAVTYGHTERLLRDSGCTVNIVRTSIFTEFFLQFLLPARQRGQLRLPAADGHVSLLSIADTSRCLAALALQAPTRLIHQLTGPAALGMHDIAAAAAAAWQTPVSYVDVSPEDFQRQLAASELDPWWCYAFTSMFASIRQHRWETVTDDVRRISKHPSLSLRDLLDPAPSHQATHP